MSYWLWHEGHRIPNHPRTLRWLWEFASNMADSERPTIIGWD